MHGYEHSGYIISIISFCHSCIALITSFLMTTIIIYHKTHHKLKQEEKMTLLLSGNIYAVLFAYAAVLFTMNVQTLLGDIYGMNFNSVRCTFQGYMQLVLCFSLYYSLVIQAFYRLCRTVYSNYRFTLLIKFYVIIIPSSIVLGGILLSPSLFLHTIVYTTDDYCCHIRQTDVRDFLYVGSVCYISPMILLWFIYIRLAIFLHRRPTNIPTVRMQRQEKDFTAMKRVLINTSTLLILGLPGVVCTIMSIVNGVMHPLAYRIFFFGMNTGVAILSIEMIVITPQLRNIVLIASRYI